MNILSWIFFFAGHPVFMEIKKLSTRKATGRILKLNAKILKLNANIFSNSTRNFFSYCVNVAKFLNILQQANITPFF